MSGSNVGGSGVGGSNVDGGVGGVLALRDPAERARLWDLPDRRVVMLMSTAAGVAFVVILTALFSSLGAGAAPDRDHDAKPSAGAPAGAAPTGAAPTAGAPATAAPPAAAPAAAHPAPGTVDASRLAVLILDYPSKHFPYPFTIQNFMHVLFFIGLGELFVRWRVGERELRFTRQRYLPEDDETVLQFADLGPIRRKVSKAFDGEHGFLPSLIDISVLQFQSSRSVDQVAAVMNHALELIAHRVELRYGLVRFLAWMVPTVGFIGTVYGLGASLYEAGASVELDVQETARALGVGFDCTMVALVQSAVLVFLMHLAQEKEELSVNLSGTYCLRHLINRLYTGRAAS
jgi:biopolymer transport protein ExbB/TolQ